MQDAIDHISKQSESKLTIIMIAHRLQTIMTADNLLFIESNKSLLPATKGTNEYDALIKRLQEINYAHQQEDE